MRKSFYILFLILLSACTPQQRLNSLLTKHPELSALSVHTDTLRIVDIDTLTVLGWRVDTLFKLDSVFQLKKDSSAVRIERKANGIYALSLLTPNVSKVFFDTISILKTDTIFKITQAGITDIEKWSYRKDGMLIVGLSILGLILLAAILKFLF